MTEQQLQAKCFQWCWNEYCIKGEAMLFSVPNEAIQKMAWRQISSFKATGLVAGVSDMVLVLPNSVYFVEMKTETGRQSEAQKKFQKRVEALGYDYKIFRNFENFKEWVKLKLSEKQKN